MQRDIRWECQVHLSQPVTVIQLQSVHGCRKTDASLLALCKTDAFLPALSLIRSCWKKNTVLVSL